MKRIQPLASICTLLAILHYGTFSAALHTAFGVDATSQIDVGNSPPVVSAIILNNGNPITLTAGTGTLVTVNFTVSDNNGCGDVMFATSTLVDRITGTLYRSGVGQACSANTLNCYVDGPFEHNCPNATSTQTSFNSTATLTVYYFAEATDASSSFSSQNWLSYIEAADASNATGSATSTAVELNSLNAIDLASSSLAYGTVSPGTDTTSTNQTATVVNAGNTSTTLQISGNALSSGGNAIATSSQHYATSTFTYGGLEQALSATAQAVAGFIIIAPPLGSWSNTTAYPNAVSNYTAAANNNFVYVIGGSTSTVRYAPINATGSLGAWTQATSLPGAKARNSSAIYNGYIYEIGGIDGGSALTNVTRFAPINSTGSLGSWTNTTVLPAPTADLPVLAHNGFIYAFGGQVAAGATSSVWFAPLSATGSIGAWTTTTPMTVALVDHSAAQHDGYVYLAGGSVGASNTSTVRVARINATGSLGAWATTAPMPYAINRHSAAIDSDIFYAFGGQQPDSTATSTGGFTPISANGELGTWSISNLPQARSSVEAVWSNGFLYLISGSLVGSVTSSVIYTPLASRNTYWGLSVPGGSPAGTYTGTVNYTAVFSP